MFKNKKESIEFVTSIPGIETIDDCIPKPSKAYTPEWFKNIPSHINGTVKQCPSFPDYFSQGYVIPMWQDVTIRYTKKDNTWNVRAYPISNDHPVNDMFGIHSNGQFIDFVSPWMAGSKANFVFKFNSPWRIITPPGWSVLQLPVFYHFNEKFSAIPGVLDTDIMHDINVQLMYHSDEEEIFIERGTPLAMYFPFKREDRLKQEIRYQNESDTLRFKSIKAQMQSKFPGTGTYRLMQRERDRRDR